MFPVTDSTREVAPDSPLSSAVLRYSLRPSPNADAPSPMVATATEGTAEVEDAFNLDLRVITDVPPSHPLAACNDGTNDGCDPTCDSACVTGGV